MILANVLRRVNSRKYRILFKLEITSSQYESEYTGTRHSRLFARNLRSLTDKTWPRKLWPIPLTKKFKRPSRYLGSSSCVLSRGSGKGAFNTRLYDFRGPLRLGSRDTVLEAIYVSSAAFGLFFLSNFLFINCIVMHPAVKYCNSCFIFYFFWCLVFTLLSQYSTSHFH
jgi:hypothetical protein